MATTKTKEDARKAQLSDEKLLGHSTSVVNNNANTTFSSGGDVYNYNPIHSSVNNYFQVTKAEENILGQIKLVIGDRFVPAALYDTQPEEAGCMPGTRTRVLSMFFEWAKDDPMRIFWLAGLAGTGKTSIAVTLCHMLQNEPDLVFGGAFFCSRIANISELTDARCIIPTLATIFAEQTPVFAAALAAQLAVDSRAPLKPISVQVIQLLQKPLSSLSSSSHPIIFLIDALDECSDENEVKKLIRAISTLACDAKVKFIVTSRPETHISISLASDTSFILKLHTIDKEEVTEDIRACIDHAFSEHPLDEEWYTTSDIDLLANCADGLFIFASTVFSYILDTESVEDRMARLQTALFAMKDSKVATGPLDIIYEFVLTRASNTAEVEPRELAFTQQTLACILAARVPLSIAVLAELLGRKSEVLRGSLRRLRSVVHVPDDVNQPELRTVHASFGDYLCERASAELRISATLGNELLARGCIFILAEQLHFNVSNSRTSHEANTGIGSSNVTLSLEYACLQWAYHLAGLTHAGAFDEELKDTICPRFLFWLEVMSILGQVQRASAMLIFAAATVSSMELARFLRDANAFVASSREAIERSAPHIYLSAVPFAAKNSLIYTTFSSLIAGVVSVQTSGIDRHGQRLVMTLTGHQYLITSVVYAPDGRLVSGSWDGTVRIWDTRTGEELASLSCGGDRFVTCVAVNSTGTSIAASTESGALLIWNLKDLQRPPLRLPEYPAVSSIAFSSDGRLISAAANDNTVHLWVVETGQQIVVLSGPTRRVLAVVLSPDGKTMAASSTDTTLRLWYNIIDQAPEMHVLARNELFHSVCFSPDGAKLAAGLNSGTIRLWDVMTRSNIETLHGHSRAVHSVQFSPDGRSLVSASSDSTARLWDLHQDAGNVSSVVLRGHSELAASAAFSPDGLFVASASSGSTIQIWDASIDLHAAQPLKAHQEAAVSVATSENGAFIASCSTDGTVRLWNSQTGDLKLPPNTYSLSAVVISPDARITASVVRPGGLQLWDLRTGNWIGEPLRHQTDVPQAMSFSPDARWVACGSTNGSVYIWDVATQQELDISPLSCHPGPVSVAIEAGTRVSDETIQPQSISSTQPTTELVKSIAFSPVGRIVAASDTGGYIHFWDMGTGQRAREPLHETGNQFYKFPIAFSPSGLEIATSGGEKIGRVWEIAEGEHLFNLVGHTDEIASIAYSPRGTFIITGSLDYSVRLWDVKDGGQLAVLHGHTSAVVSIACTSNNRSIVSSSRDSTIRVWDVESALAPSTANDEGPMVALELGGLHDGWVLGEAGELLLWVPKEYRAYLNLPSCRLLIAKHRITITTEEVWHHGDDWTACWLGDSSA